MIEVYKRKAFIMLTAKELEVTLFKSDKEQIRDMIYQLMDIVDDLQDMLEEE